MLKQMKLARAGVGLPPLRRRMSRGFADAALWARIDPSPAPGRSRGGVRERRMVWAIVSNLIKGGNMSKKLLAIAIGTAATIGVAHAAPPTFYAGGDIVGLTT